MSDFPITELNGLQFPELLKQIPDCPKRLFIQGEFPLSNSLDEDLKFLTIVGSRKYSEYAKSACEMLIEGLRGYPIVIISGLALGIDSIAHRAAIKNGLKTIAVPGSGLHDSVLYPRSHLGLRDSILENGGCLISEFSPDFKATLWSFPKRNRVMAGLSHAVFVMEAEIKSGTLITSKFATEYNRDVFTIPHSIFSPGGEGPHMLLRLGATPITKSEDILTAFGFDTSNNKNLFTKRDYAGCTEEELEIITFLKEPTSRDEILRASEKPIHITQTTLSSLEIKGLIREEMGLIMLS